MSTTSHVTIDEGSTTQLPTYDISEDAATKKLSRSVLNKSDGTELIGQQTAANSIPVIIPSATVTTLTPPSNTGYSTSAKQDTELASLASIDGKITAVNTGAVTVATSALPSGASTAANQSTSNTSLGNIDTNAGATSDAAATAGGTGTIAAKLRKISADIGTVATNTGAATPAGSNLIGKVGIDQTTPGTTNAVSATNLPTTVATNTGNATASTPRVVIASDQTAFTVNNAVTDVAPATQNITVVDSGSTSTVSANGQALITGTATASSTASFAISGIETIKVQVTGTWTGTLASETSIDGGTTWVGAGLHQGAFTTGTFTANFVGGLNTSGATNYRVRATATITGTATVKVTESFNTASVYLANAAPSGNYVSLLNSSTSNLTSGSTFTGVGEDVSNFSEMRISVYADVASSTNGLVIQQSSNNTTWRTTDTYTIAATTFTTFNIPRQARYFRVAYTNGGTNQATFELSSILNRTATAPSSQRPQDGYTNETDLVQSQGFNMVYNGTTWDRAPGDTTGVKVKQVANTATLSNVAASASSVTLLSANTARIGAQITNDSSAVVYIKFGTTASTTSYTVSLAGAASAPFPYYEVPAGYTGRIDAIWASATGNARVTEET